MQYRVPDQLSITSLHNSNFKAASEVDFKAKEAAEEAMIDLEIHGHNLQTNRNQDILSPIASLGY
jgi:hypothetical protein